MFRFYLAIVSFFIANLISIIGYKKGKKEGHPRPYTVFVLYVAVSIGIMALIVNILNFFGLYPK